MSDINDFLWFNMNFSQQITFLEKHNAQFKIVRAVCLRCSGTGTYSLGVCFRCAGDCIDPSLREIKFIVRPAGELLETMNADLAKREIASQKRAAKKDAKRIADREEFLAKSPACVLFLENHRNEKWEDKVVLNPEGMMRNEFDHLLPSFGHEIATKCLDFNNISEKQEAALLKVINQTLEKLENRAEQEANTPDAPNGRVVITGKVMSIKSFESDFGWQKTTVWKMFIVADEGFKVFVSIPKALPCDMDKGTRVTFTATLTRSDDDRTFAKGSRPSKASIIEESTIN